MRGIMCGGALLALIGCTAQQTATTVAQGQLYCALATATGPLVVALADTAGAPITATNKAQADVAALCALINAIPVSPPASPAATPVVAVAVPAAAPATKS